MYQNKIIKVLNIGAGKPSINEIERFHSSDNTIMTCLDRCYASYNKSNFESEILDCYNFNQGSYQSSDPRIQFISSDLFDFLDRYHGRFKYVFASRIFEHMEYCSGEIGRLLEACNNITEDEAVLEIIVPNALEVAKMLNYYESAHNELSHIDSTYHKLIINSEFTNIKADPHASVWTPVLAKEYILSEGTWTIHSIEPLKSYKQRSIYMRILCYKGSLYSTHMIDRFDITKKI